MKFSSFCGHNDEVTLTKGGERFNVKIGNTVIDIMHGYNHDKGEPVAIVDVYSYESKQESHVLMRDGDKLIVSR